MTGDVILLARTRVEAEAARRVWGPHLDDLASARVVVAHSLQQVRGLSLRRAYVYEGARPRWWHHWAFQAVISHVRASLRTTPGGDRNLHILREPPCG